MTTRYVHIDGLVDPGQTFHQVFKEEESMNSTTEQVTLGEAAGVAAENMTEFNETLEKFEERLKGADWWLRYRLWGKLVAEGKKHSYEGTVPQKVIDKRRAANKVAKASRKKNR